MCFNLLFTVNLYRPHGGFWVNNTPSHILHFPVRASAARRHALYRGLQVQLSLNNGNSRAAPYSTDTPHNYTIQLCNSISIQTCTTHIHTHREGASVTHSPTKGVWRVMPNQKQKNVERVRILEASEWNDRWDTTARKGFDQGNNVKQLRKMKKTWSERMRKDQKVKARERERLYCTKRLYRTTMIQILIL